MRTIKVTDEEAAAIVAAADYLVDRDAYEYEALGRVADRILTTERDDDATTGQ